MFKLFFLLLFLGGWTLAAASLHVVRTPSNFLTLAVVPKNDLTFDDTYVDTRQWTLDDVSKHSAFVRRVLSADKPEILAHLTDPKSSHDAASQLSEAVAEAPEPAHETKKASPSALHAALAQLKAGKLRPEDLARLVSAQ